MRSGASTGDKRVCPEASRQTQLNPVDKQRWCSPPSLLLPLSQRLPENTNLLHHLQLLPQALHLFL